MHINTRDSCEICKGYFLLPLLLLLNFFYTATQQHQLELYLSTYLSIYLSDRVRMAVTFFKKPTNITDNHLLLAQPFVDRRVVVAFFYVVRGQELLYSQINKLSSLLT